MALGERRDDREMSGRDEKRELARWRDFGCGEISSAWLLFNEQWPDFKRKFIPASPPGFRDAALGG